MNNNKIRTKTFFFFFFLSLPFVLFSQSGIVQVYGYSQGTAFGNPPAGEYETPRLRYFAYLEIKPAKLAVTYAWINGSGFDVETKTVSKSAVSPGTGLDGKTIRLKATARNKLLFLQFLPSGHTKKIPAFFTRKKAGTMLLEIMVNGKKQYVSVPTITPLKADLSKG